jgi:hypothetical protein
LLSFLIILFLSLVYEWNDGSLEWVNYNCQVHRWTSYFGRKYLTLFY